MINDYDLIIISIIINYFYY